jgi:soluble lytic murein transglycosylase
VSPRTAQLQVARRRARRARAARRRRQAFLLLGFLAVVSFGALLLRPLFTSAVHDLTALPLHHQDAIRQQAHDKRLDPSLLAGVI